MTGCLQLKNCRLQYDLKSGPLGQQASAIPTALTGLKHIDSSFSHMYLSSDAKKLQYKCTILTARRHRLKESCLITFSTS